MRRKNEFYVVARGHQTGIFRSWEQRQKQRRGFKKQITNRLILRKKEKNGS